MKSPFLKKKYLISCVIFFITWNVFFLEAFSQNLPDLRLQKVKEESIKINNQENQLSYFIKIIDEQSKYGNEINDTTVTLNSELTLYAGLFNDNGRYYGRNYVRWYWSKFPEINDDDDQYYYLGSGYDYTFKPTELLSGFIFVPKKGQTPSHPAPSLPHSKHPLFGIPNAWPKVAARSFQSDDTFERLTPGK